MMLLKQWWGQMSQMLNDTYGLAPTVIATISIYQILVRHLVHVSPTGHKQSMEDALSHYSNKDV